MLQQPHIELVVATKIFQPPLGRLTSCSDRLAIGNGQQVAVVIPWSGASPVAMPGSRADVPEDRTRESRYD